MMKKAKKAKKPWQMTFTEATWITSILILETMSWKCLTMLCMTKMVRSSIMMTAVVPMMTMTTMKRKAILKNLVHHNHHICRHLGYACCLALRIRAVMLNAHPILVRGITFLSREPRLKHGSPQITLASCQVPIRESRHRQLANCRLQEGNEQKFPQRTKDSRHSANLVLRDNYGDIIASTLLVLLL